MALTAGSVIDLAADVLQDASNVTWTRAKLLTYVNDAQRAVVGLKPDASVSTSSITLVAGTKQSITGVRLRAVHRNMGTDGLTPGRGIRLVERASKDEFSPDWHAATAKSEIREYMYDENVPKEFYVSPPSTTSPVVQIEVSQVVNPTDVATETDSITIDDIYAPALREWVLYLSFSRDSIRTPNYQRAVDHRNTFVFLITGKRSVDRYESPKTREQLK